MRTGRFTAQVALVAATLITGAAVAAPGAAAAQSGPAARARSAASASQAALGGEVDHWGAFFGDQLISHRNLTLLPAGLTFPDFAPVQQVGSSNSTQYALLTDGTLWAWGQGSRGQLGDGSTASSFTAPVRVRFPSGVRIAYLATDAMPYDTALAVDTNGHAWGWGMNKAGELCLGTTSMYTTPQELPLSAPVTSLAGASGHAVYDAAGHVVSCGNDDGGVLGDGSRRNVPHHTPVPVQGLGRQPVAALVSAFDNAGALLANGRYYDWGFNTSGQLGDGTLTSSNVPVLVPLPHMVTQVAQGGSAPTNGQTLVQLSDGTFWSWGNDTWSQLGDQGLGLGMGMQRSPVRFFPPNGVTYATLASGGGTSYGISTTGAVYAWGAGFAGQIGDGGKATAVTPVRVDSGAGTISATAQDVVVGP
jgi:alpha-tubulin suppressor-like RCC1 family protein